MGSRQISRRKAKKKTCAESLRDSRAWENFLLAKDLFQVVGLKLGILWELGG
jgi:hypothetical protein